MADEIYRDSGVAVSTETSATAVYNFPVRVSDNAVDAVEQPGCTQGTLLVSGVALGTADASPESAMWRIDYTVVYPGSGDGNPYLLQATTLLASNGTAPTTAPSIALQGTSHIAVSSGHYATRTVRWVFTNTVVKTVFDGLSGST